MNIIVVFNGGQGSGKTTLAEIAKEYFKSKKIPVLYYGIKNTFTAGVDSCLESLGIKTTLLQYKELQRAISTWGEKHVDENIWSTMYKDRVSIFTSLYGCVVTEDIRTTYNLRALRELADDNKKVILFRLIAPEEIRKKRCTAWRQEICYTEQALEKPSELPNSFRWIDIDTTRDLISIKKEIIEIIEAENAKN